MRSSRDSQRGDSSEAMEEDIEDNIEEGRVTESRGVSLRTAKSGGLELKTIIEINSDSLRAEDLTAMRALP